MKNIHILPTDQPSRLHLWTDENGMRLALCELEYSHTRNTQNLYITSDEEIKEGVNQWYLDKFLNKPRNSGGAQYGEKQNIIILTTDQKLIDDGVQEIEDYFLQWFVENPTCEFVEVNKKLVEFPLTFKMMYKIIIPQEGIDEELLPEFNLSKGVFDKLSNISSKEMPQEFSKLVNENFDELISNESKQGTHYNFIIQNDKYKMLLAMQTYPETKYYFKDDEISVEELILKLDNGESSEIKYSEDEVRELLIKGLTHNDDKLCGSLVTVQKEIRTANFNVWFEENKKK